jgi:hypothetical protein
MNTKYFDIDVQRPDLTVERFTTLSSVVIGSDGKLLLCERQYDMTENFRDLIPADEWISYTVVNPTKQRQQAQLNVSSEPWDDIPTPRDR